MIQIAPIIIVICAAVGVGYTYYSGKPDNAVEQVAERIIETQMGLPKDTIDLTPDKK
jgi:hypothetical protein